MKYTTSIILTCIVILLVPCSSRAQFTDMIAYTSNKDGNGEIYIMKPDGANQTRLTDNSAQDLYPSWSPDASKITFGSNRDGNYEIYILDVNNPSNQTRLTNNSADDYKPSWSPDGSQIAFQSERDGNWELYVLDVNNPTNQTRLTDNSATDYGPSWSPDGSQITFYSNRDGNEEIYILDVNNPTNQTRLTDNPAIDSSPKWSPDGSKIVFHSNRFGWEIFVMDINNPTNQTRLTDNLYDDEWASWSPDGSKITFVSTRGGNREIYVMDSDGQNQIRLTDDPANSASCPSWSTNAFITLTSPNGSESWEASTTQNITWTSTGVTDVKLEYSTNNGTGWTEIATDINASIGSYEWTIPIRPSVNCSVKVSDVSNASINDTSDTNFTITESTGNTILFSSDRDGYNNIYVMNIDGTTVTKLTNTVFNDYQASFSSSGSKIVFSSNRDGIAQIWIMNSDGSNQTKIPISQLSDHLCLYPSLSPDESKIVFFSNVSGYNIFVCNIDGSNLQQLTNSYCQYPSWSPDGMQIAYEGRYENGVDQGDIYIMNADGTGKVNLTNTPAAEDDEFIQSWSPDGTKIAYCVIRILNGEQRREIFVRDIATGEETRVTYSDNNIVSNSCPTWSPDGSQIAFYTNRDDNGEIYIMDSTDGSNFSNLTNDPSADSYPSFKQALSVRSVVLTSPLGGESWEASTTQNITWTSTGVTNVKLEYSTNNGTDWTEIIASTPADGGPYAWTVPIRPSVNCLVRVSGAGNASINDVSDTAFTITAYSDLSGT